MWGLNSIHQAEILGKVIFRKYFHLYCIRIIHKSVPFNPSNWPSQLIGSKMGCLCCRDRHKPLDQEAQQYSPLPNAVYLSEPDEIRKPILRSQVKLEFDLPDVGNAETSSGGTQTISQEHTNTGKRTDISPEERLEGVRVVSGGATCSYRLEEERVGNLVKAEHRDTRKRCWIQTSTRKSKKRNQERKQRLELLQSLDHPNILKMLDVFQDESHIYTVYEATEGGNAEALSTKVGAVSERLGAAIMQQVFAALSYCHSKGLALQPFYPQNILFSAPFAEECPAVKLLVPFQEKLHKDSQYVAPEFKNKTYIGPNNDLWTCGVVLSSLIAGQNVFNNMQASMVSQKFRSGYNKWQEVSKPAKSLTLALIARDYRKRPSPEKCLQHVWISGS